MLRRLSHKTEGTSALKNAALNAMDKVTDNNVTDVPKIKVAPELPDMELVRMSLMYYSDQYPTQQELVTVSEYLEAAYGLRCQYATVDLKTGTSSWTDPKAQFVIAVALQGKKQ